MSRAQNLNSWYSIYDGYKQFTMTTAANQSSPTLQIPEKIDEYHGFFDRHQYIQIVNENWTAHLVVKRDYSTIIHVDIKPANILPDGNMVYTDEYHGFDDLHKCFHTLNEICYLDVKRDYSTIIHGDIKPANILPDGNMVYTDEYHGFDDLQQWNEICYLDGKRDYSTIIHGDIKPANILLNGNNMVPKISDFGISKPLMEEERMQTKESYIGIQGYMAMDYIYNNLNKFYMFSLGVIMLEILTGPTGYSNNPEMASQHFTQIMKIIIEIDLSFVDIIEYVFIIPFAHDILVLLNSGASLSAAVDVDRINLLLDSDGKALAAIPSMHSLFFWSNLADERSDKPRSNTAPATNSSQETTHAPMANKLIDDEAENHSDPNSCVIERDTNEKEKRSAEWYIATGAAHHATWKRDLLSNLVDVENDGLCVHAADGTPMPVCGRGNVVTDDVVLRDVYYVPDLCTNLVSVGQLAGLDYCIGFGRGACIISSSAGAVVGRAHARGDGVYEVDFLRVPLSVP